MTRRRKVVTVVAAVVAVLVLAAVAGMAYLNRSRPAFNVAADGVALSGYDPVSYFAEGGGQPRPGEAAITAEHQGRRYRFVSTENRDRFVADPQRFEPQYGGWCAYAVANGYKFEVDPESYMIADDRLLLFYRGMLGDARGEFEKEGVDGGVQKADANWPKLGTDG